MSHTRFAVLAAVLCALSLSACGGGQDAVGAPPPIGFELDNPLLDAKPGEWALLEAPDGRTYYWKILEVDLPRRVVRYLEEVRAGDVNEIVDRGERTAGLNHFLFGFQAGRSVVRKVLNGRIEAGGRTWDAMAFEYASGISGVVRAWYSNEAPVLGLIRMEKIDGLRVTTAYELVDWSGKE